MIFIVLLIVLLVLLFRYHHQKAPSPPTSTTSTAPPAVIEERAPVLTETDNGKTISLNIGEHRIVRLKGNPTTGYAWRTVKLKGDSIRIANDWTYTQDEAPKTFVGVGGHYDLDLEAVMAGRTDLYLIYAPVTDSQSIGYTYKLTLRVLGEVPTYHATIIDDKRTIMIDKNDHVLIDLPEPAPGFHWRVLQGDVQPIDPHRFLYHGNDSTTTIILGKYHGRKNNIVSVYTLTIEKKTS